MKRNLYAGNPSSGGFSLNIFNDDEVADIHLASMEILEKTGVFVEDIEALKEDAARAKQLGFQGKLCIHPNQIEPLRVIFTPTAEEISFARRVVEVFEAEEAAGSAAILVDGKFVDYPVVERSRRILQLADIIDGK